MRSSVWPVVRASATHSSNFSSTYRPPRLRTALSWSNWAMGFPVAARRDSPRRPHFNAGAALGLEWELRASLPPASSLASSSEFRAQALQAASCEVRASPWSMQLGASGWKLRSLDAQLGASRHGAGSFE